VPYAGRVPEPSLADRKRHLVVDELTEAALQTLAVKGFEATTVDEVAAAAGVSRRTFFRHFASKEDVVVHLLAALGDLIAAELASRPRAESPSVALRHALAAGLDDCTPGDGDHAVKALRVAQLVLANPSLLARFLEHQSAWQDDLTVLLATRLGADPESDLRPRLAAGIALAAFQAVLRRWAATSGAEDAQALLAEAFRHLAPALDGLTGPAGSAAA
jgi:AcrR family transcriptional regulator